MNIVIAGKNNIAVNVTEYILEKYKNDNVYAICNQNDYGVNSFQRSYKNFCLKNKVKIVSLDDVYQIENLTFISLEFDKIINPKRFLTKNIFNIHFSKLPKYRGMYTSVFPILNGETESGVTFHLIERGIDTGDIVDQFVFPIEKNETASSLYKKYIEQGTNLVIKNLKNIFQQDFKAKKQAIDNASYYGKDSLNFNSLNINHNKCAFEIKKQYLSLTFRAYQLPRYQDKSIFGVKILDNKSNEKPGTLISSCNLGFKLASVDYDILLCTDKFDELMDACKSGNINIVNNLISFNPLLVNEKNNNGWSPIIVAAYNGHLNVIKLLYQHGACINDMNFKGTSVLMYAKNYLEASGDSTVINWLIDHGADINHVDFNNKSVIDYVSLNGSICSRKFFDL